MGQIAPLGGTKRATGWDEARHWVGHNRPFSYLNHVSLPPTPYPLHGRGEGEGQRGFLWVALRPSPPPENLTRPPATLTIWEQHAPLDVTLIVSEWGKTARFQVSNRVPLQGLAGKIQTGALPSVAFVPYRDT